MQSIYGQQLTHHALLFNTMQCQQEKAVTPLSSEMEALIAYSSLVSV